MAGAWLSVLLWSCLESGQGLMNAGAADAAAAPVRVLIFSGQNNHDWRSTTPQLKSILAGSGRFAVDITEHPEQVDATTFARYDVILSDWNTFPADAKIKAWPEQMRQNFLGFVRNGGGYVVVHAGSSSFEDWTDYRRLSGAAWGKGTGHGPIHAFEVRMADPDHPITRGLESFQTTDELWHRAESHPRKVLATAFSDKDKGGSGEHEPVAMITEFGQGRCFTLLLGHNTQAMQAPGFQALLRRGTEWAATGQVTLTGPNQPASEADQVDNALQAVAGYRFGDSRQTLSAVEKLVQEAPGDSGLRRKLAASFVALMGSQATPEAKEFACRQLSLIGSSAEVPALARLLLNTNLTYFARLALERIPGPESLGALHAALANTTGQVRIGLVNSLASRGSQESVPHLATLIHGADAETRETALYALGKIGGSRAVQELLKAAPEGPNPWPAGLAEALLRSGEQLLSAGNSQDAAAILKRLVGVERRPTIRLAAFPLYISALGDQGGAMLLSALEGEDQLMQSAAIRALRLTQNGTLLETASRRLNTLRIELQVQVMALAAERGEARVLPAVLRAVSAQDQAVRQAALSALGSLGNQATVPFLASLLPNADDAEKKLIAAALARLRGADVDEAIVTALQQLGPSAQPVLVQALTARGAKSAVPALVPLAASQDTQVRREAVAALETLGDLSTCAPLIGLLEKSPDPGGIQTALSQICRREGTIAPVVDALPKLDGAQRARLLGVAGAVGGPEALAVLRHAVDSDQADVRTAAVRSLANWQDAAPLNDLAAVGTTATEARLKALAWRGVARLAPLGKDQPANQRVDLLRRGLAHAAVGEQQALLGALGEIPSLDAMQAALAWLEQPDLAEEAGLAALKSVEAASGIDRAAAQAALQQVMATCKSPAVTSRAVVLTLRFGEFHNLSLDATASSPDGLEADGQAGGDQAALDGKPETYWDEVDNAELYRLRVQFPRPSKVVLLRLMGWQHHRYAPRDLEILCDGQMVKQVTDAQYQDNWFTVELPPTDCTTLELKITRSYGPSPAIRELEIYGKPAGN